MTITLITLGFYYAATRSIDAYNVRFFIAAPAFLIISTGFEYALANALSSGGESFDVTAFLTKFILITGIFYLLERNQEDTQLFTWWLIWIVGLILVMVL